MKFVYNDGGRKAAGYKGVTGDCVTRAIAIVTEQSYEQVYDALNVTIQEEMARTRAHSKKARALAVSSSRTGVSRKAYHAYLHALGYEWIPTMTIGSGCKVHLAGGELPVGRLIVRLSRHMAAVVDGVLNDTYDCSREGTRCVYGYYIKRRT
jgi:hypothetical protein